MQRGGEGGVGVAINGEMDVAQLVGCGVAVVRVEGSAEKVLARPEEPEEGDDREVEEGETSARPWRGRLVWPCRGCRRGP